MFGLNPRAEILYTMSNIFWGLQIFCRTILFHMRQFCLTCTFVKLKYQNLKIPEDDKKVVIDQMCQVDPLFGASS